MIESILYKTAIYCRLSLDDGSLGESGSIQTQKMMLEKYCRDNNFTIKEVYDAFGNAETISAGDCELADYTYNSKNGKLKEVEYGNGFKIRYVYDELENLSEVWYNEVKTYEYTYTADGLLHSVKDYASEKGMLYKYDSADRLTGVAEYSLSDGYTDASTMEIEWSAHNLGYYVTKNRIVNKCVSKLSNRDANKSAESVDIKRRDKYQRIYDVVTVGGLISW